MQKGASYIYWHDIDFSLTKEIWYKMCLCSAGFQSEAIIEKKQNLEEIFRQLNKNISKTVETDKIYNAEMVSRVMENKGILKVLSQKLSKNT